MEPGTPTSFIPKRPVETNEVTVHHSSGVVGLFSLLTFIIVIGTALTFVAVFFYQKQLVTQKANLDQSINKTRDGIGTDFVSDMKRLDARIAGSKDLIKNHVVVSPIFAALEDSTLRSIQYKDFSYTIKNDAGSKTPPTVVVSLSGVAKSYATIALQSDAFSSNDLVKNPVFSDLTVDDKTRQVNFKLTFSVSMSDLSYQTFIDGIVKKQQNIVVPDLPALEPVTQ